MKCFIMVHLLSEKLYLGYFSYSFCAELGVGARVNACVNVQTIAFVASPQCLLVLVLRLGQHRNLSF